MKNQYKKVMKKYLFTTALLALATLAMAQTDKQETTYRRSSLYTIMLPDEELTGDQLATVKDAFLTNTFPDKYNDHNLADRVLDLTKIKAIEVTQAEIDAAQESTGKKGSKLGSLAKKGLNFAKKAAAESSENASDSASAEGSKDAKYIAKLTKYFNANHVAGKMVAKWLGGPETAPKKATAMSTSLIEERGLNTLSQDELLKAQQAVGGKEKLVAAAEYDLMNRTFVMVNRYSYVSAEEIIAYISAAASAVGGGQIAMLAGAGLAAAIKGYFVKTNTYLFQLDVTNDKINEIVEKYSKDIRGLYTDSSIKFKYVGKTSDFAPATMQVNLKSDADTKLVARATVRATDGAIAKLQKKYDEFKTLATLHQDGENLYAFVGAKEGCDEGDKFEVLQKVLDDNGLETYEVVGKVSIEKGQLWDNRAGAQEKLEGGATTKEKGKANASLTYSGFGKSKKLLEGSLIRQIK